MVAYSGRTNVSLIVLCLIQLYGAATMNNTLCLGIFAALVGFRDLTWQYSAEVTVILLIQLVMAVVALVSGFLNHHTYLVSLY